MKNLQKKNEVPKKRNSSDLIACCNIKLKLQSSVTSASLFVSQPRHACDSTVGTSIWQSIQLLPIMKTALEQRYN